MASLVSLLFLVCLGHAVSFIHVTPEIIKESLHGISAAWAHWNQLGTSGKQAEWPTIMIEITQPPLGLKVTPRGMHPFKYLCEVPELQDHVMADADISYLLENGIRSSISGTNDWLSFFQFLENRFPDGTSPKLELKFMASKMKQSLWARSFQALQDTSEKLRTFGKSLMMREKVKAEDFEKEQTFLESEGFTQFDGKGYVFEELGYTKEDWPDLVDSLVESGVPSVWGKTLKLAAKAKRGSIKSLVTFSWQDGHRIMNYMKFQVLPDGHGGVDGLFATYQLTAHSTTKKTGIKLEQSFQRFVEMDAHQKWKKDVRQLMPETPEESSSGEL